MIRSLESQVCLGGRRVSSLALPEQVRVYLSPSAAIISSTSGSAGYGFRPSTVSGGYVANSTSCISGVCSVRGGESRSRSSGSDYKDTLTKGSSLSTPSKKGGR